MLSHIFLTLRRQKEPQLSIGLESESVTGDLETEVAKRNIFFCSWKRTLILKFTATDFTE